jgi:hypothetical protein
MDPDPSEMAAREDTETPVLDWRERLVCSRWRPAGRRLPRRNLERGDGSDRVPPAWAGLAGDGGAGAIRKLARWRARLEGSPHSGRYFWDDRLTASVNLMSISISISNKSRAGDAGDQLHILKIPGPRRTA